MVFIIKLFIGYYYFISMLIISKKLKNHVLYKKFNKVSIQKLILTPPDAQGKKLVKINIQDYYFIWRIHKNKGGDSLNICLTDLTNFETLFPFKLCSLIIS